MKTNELFKRTYNQCLDLLGTLKPQDPIWSETALAARLHVSRTTVRAILQLLAERDIIRLQGRTKLLLRPPQRGDHFAKHVVEPVAEVAEKRFMAWIVGPDCSPGTYINALDLSRKLGISSSSIRDCLTRFSHYGMIERDANGRWRCLGLTVDFVQELFEIREMQELRAVERFVKLPASHPAWAQIEQIAVRHRHHLGDHDSLLREFSDYDSQLHLVINEAAQNRFFLAVQNFLGLVFPYHYDSDKAQNQGRKLGAVHEHLSYIKSLQARDLERARADCQRHLHSARNTLLHSIAAKSVPEIA